MKKILNIIFQTEIIGGVERFLEYFSHNTEYDQYFIGLFDKKINTNYKGKLTNLGESIRINNPIRLLYLIFKRAYLYKVFCEKEHIDISLSHGDSLNLSNIISKLLFNNESKIYIVLHNSLWFYKNKISFIYRILFKILYPQADKIITVSNEMKEELENSGYKNINVLYNPIDLLDIERKKLEPINGNNKIFQDNKTFITIGRLEEVKNINFLVECFTKFNQRHKDYKFIIIGGGKDYNDLRKTITNENIFLLGNQKNVYKFINRASFFLFASLNEGFGRVLIESLVCGVPVISHDFKYGAKEIIRNNNNLMPCKKIEIHDNGILVPYNDKERFIEGMEKAVVMKFNKLRISQNTSKYDIERFRSGCNLIFN